VQPDKDAPLWNRHTEVICWRTDTAGDNDADRVVDNGLVNAVPRRRRPPCIGCRCVRDEHRNWKAAMRVVAVAGQVPEYAPAVHDVR
jgi:hypothetical protein